MKKLLGILVVMCLVGIVVITKSYADSWIKADCQVSAQIIKKNQRSEFFGYEGKGFPVWDEYKKKSYDCMTPADTEEFLGYRTLRQSILNKVYVAKPPVTIPQPKDTWKKGKLVRKSTSSK